ncbi:trigger factor [Nanchangia anserum]|uniref:Trigger factor n=2 Tax=Nanchangia anserum TaxID=2692125 RepID=A0A8I0KPG1_9ACTO|nr:trigger factor [Nanchangia anserum]MBD3688865.1 trigger factor [Nanchangia anserum]
MKSSVETLEATKVKISVEVPYDELKPALDSVYKDLSDQVNVPGFRRGHVPAQIIDQRIGRGYVIEQAVNQNLQDYYAQAITENDLTPMGAPEVDVTDLPNVEGKREGDLKFTVEVEVLPTLEIPSFEGVAIEVAPVEVTDAQVDDEITALRQRFGTLKAVERAAQDGDFTSIDLKAEIDGDEIDSMSGVSYEIGSGTLLEGIDEALTGLEVGQDATFTSQMRGGEHAGEDATVTVSLKAVKERELPELDDDFVQMASEWDTVDELKESVRGDVAKSMVSEQAVEARDKVLDHLREAVEVPLPAGVLADALKNRVAEDASDEDKKQAEDELRAGLRDQILLDNVVRARGVEIDQKELFDNILAMTQSYGIDPMQLLGDRNQVAMIHDEMARSKAVGELLKEADIRDTEGNEIDMSVVFGSSAQDAEANAAAAAEAAAEAQDEADEENSEN